jgi:nicotinamide/nicotinate riboside kinase
VDGFLIYHSTELCQLFDIKIFTKASFNTLIKRRTERNSYVTKTGLWADPYFFLITSPRYFEDVVWPSYLKYNKHILCLENEHGKNTDYLLLDSEDLNIEQMVGQAISHILSYLRSNS